MAGWPRQAWLPRRGHMGPATQREHPCPQKGGTERLGRHQSDVSARGLRPASNKAIGTPPGAMMTRGPGREGLPHPPPEGTPRRTRA